MFKRCLGLVLLAGLCVPVWADDAGTVVNDANAKQSLMGSHRFSLQWISWDRFGKADVTEADGVLHIDGEQAQDGDYVRMHGTITRVDAKSFLFNGDIETRVSHINDGKPCMRHGEMTFRMVGARKYWRLKEMQNPCVPPGDLTTDYVDVFLR
jgi:hypothetical protein